MRTSIYIHYNRDTDFKVTNSNGSTTEIYASTFAQAMSKYLETRRYELNEEGRGKKVVNTIRAELTPSGSYSLNGHRFNVMVKWFTQEPKIIETHKGHSIEQYPYRTEFHVKHEGKHIGEAKSLEEARKIMHNHGGY